MILFAESHYSIGRSTLSPAKIVDLAKSAGYTSVLLADRGCAGALYEFCAAAAKCGIKPIPAVQLEATWNDVSGWVTFVARRHSALPDLFSLTTASLISPLDLDTIAAHCRSPIFMLTGQADEGLLQKLPSIKIPGFLDALTAKRIPHAVEINRNNGPSPHEHEIAAAIKAASTPPAVLATSTCRHSGAEDLDALKVMKFIADRNAKDRNPTPLPSALHFITPGRLAGLFDDTPQALENAAILAGSTDTTIIQQSPRLPHFPGCDANTEMTRLVDQAQSGLDARAEKSTRISSSYETYKDRLAYELEHITKLGYAGYFLIVADFIAHARNKQIPVGPGRGSGAGSLVAYSLGITELDPIRFGLYFERFINPNRVSLPDFDIDFCETRRDEVIAYVISRYGADRVAQIGTYNSRLPKAAFRDAATAAGIIPGRIEAFTRLIPDGIKTLDDAATHPKIVIELERDVELKAAFETAKSLVGITAHRSRHAAGIIIADKPLTETTALYPPEAGQTIPITHYEMHTAEKTGHVKFDFLGLKTLTIIDRTCRALASEGTAINPYDLPFEDPPVFEMINKGLTKRVFQIESPGMIKAIRDIKPSTFEDLIALVALYRPGPMSYIPLYGGRKAGRIPIDYPHPALKEILSETYGIIIYQEQVMQVARTLSGYTLGEADLLRRAMGKKIKTEMDAQRARFIQGAIDNNLDEDTSNEIFDLLAKFADYGFNKSHAAAYALICWITAWLKHHHTAHFLAANMTQEIGNTDAISETIREARIMGLTVLPADINLSSPDFSTEGPAKIRYGLSGLKGFSNETAAEFHKLKTRQPFRSLEDAIRRHTALTGRSASEKTFLTLIHGGAFDCLPTRNPSTSPSTKPVETLSLDAKVTIRTGHIAALPILITDTREDVVTGQSSLFGETNPVDTNLRIDPSEIINAEERAYGFRFATHPLDKYHHLVDNTTVVTIRQSLDLARSLNSTSSPLAVLAELSDLKETSGQLQGYLADRDTRIQVKVPPGLLPPRELPAPIVATIDHDASPATLRSFVLADDYVPVDTTSLQIAFDTTATLRAALPHIRQLAKSNSGPHTIFLASPDTLPSAMTSTIANSPEIIETITGLNGVQSACYSDRPMPPVTATDRTGPDTSIHQNMSRTPTLSILLDPLTPAATVHKIADLIERRYSPEGTTRVLFSVQTSPDVEVTIDIEKRINDPDPDMIFALHALTGKNPRLSTKH